LSHGPVGAVLTATSLYRVWSGFSASRDANCSISSRFSSFSDHDCGIRSMPRQAPDKAQAMAPRVSRSELGRAAHGLKKRPFFWIIKGQFADGIAEGAPDHGTDEFVFQDACFQCSCLGEDTPSVAQVKWKNVYIWLHYGDSSPRVNFRDCECRLPGTKKAGREIGLPAHIFQHPSLLRNDQDFLLFRIASSAGPAIKIDRTITPHWPSVGTGIGISANRMVAQVFSLFSSKPSGQILSR